MDAVKGAADALRDFVYEFAGLALPGAASVLAIAFAISPDTGMHVLVQAEAHAWVATGSAYLLGFPLQAISRPVTRSIRRVARGVRDALPWALRTLGLSTAASELERRGAKLAAYIAGRHAGHDGVLGTADDTYDESFDFATECGVQWKARLALAPTRRLTAFQLDALCYSVLQRRESIDRFRAATSLCRAMATVVALTAAVRLWQVWHEGPLVWPASLAAFAGVSVLFWAFSHREDMYERLRTDALLAQTLATGLGPSASSATPALSDPRAMLRAAQNGNT